MKLAVPRLDLRPSEMAPDDGPFEVFEPDARQRGLVAPVQLAPVFGWPHFRSTKVQVGDIASESRRMDSGLGGTSVGLLARRVLEG